MAQFYLRKAIVEILPATGPAKRIEELRVKFKCEKTSESHPNKGELEIYNLNDQSRSLLEQPKTRVHLIAGYRDIFETIFIGNITKPEHKREKADIITKIKIGDGDNKHRNARLEKGYPPGTSTSSVFDDLAGALGLPFSAKKGIPNTKYANGLTLSGLARDHLTDLSKKNDLEWTIQDETLQVIPRDQATDDELIVIGPDSGLVGFPAKTTKGVQFDCLLNPKLRPGRPVKLESRVVTGIFRLRKVTHEGDSQQGDWKSKCEASV